ncbi:MAG: efflux RND transporter periplasmic adaptor subunit [Acidobacteria bacterium]|nr:efflux RND transporter periplasmic adaptor subunit [Acidobacteriota bacterium]
MKLLQLCPLAFLMSAIIVFSACGGSPSRTGVDVAASAMPVRTARVVLRDLDETLVLTGNLRPRAQVEIVAEVAARLLRIEKDEGARVTKGDVLAVLDDTDYGLAGDRARAALAVAEANRAHAVVERERADNLLKTGGITDKDHLSAQVNLQVADAAFAQARAETAIAAEQQARCQVRAVFNGRIARRLVDPGAMLAVGTPIFTLVDDSVLEFRASVPSGDYAKVRVGAQVDVTVDSLPGFRAHGKMARVAPIVDERSRAFDVVVEVPGGKELVGGLFARATVDVARIAGAVVVPPAALIRDGSKPGEAQVFVVDGTKALRKTVALGTEAADAVQITHGLSEGDILILDPPVALASGTLVEVKR